MKPTPSRFPFPAYPQGWFAVARSSSLPTRSVQPIHYFGRDLVLLRSASGQACVFDAPCAHRGHHLGLVGTLQGETLRCGQHGWTYDLAGRCIGMPAGSRAMVNASVHAWPVVERNGVVLVYHGAEDRGAPPPALDVPQVEELSSPEWTEPNLLHWKVRTRNQEIMENSFDTAHFVYVHGTPRVPCFDDVVASGPTLRAYTDVLDIRVHGLGMLIVRDLSGLAGRGRGNMHATFVTPLDEEQVEVWMHLSVRRLEDEAATRAMVELWRQTVYENFARDIVIWEHKAYLPSPVLAEGDGPIPLFRRWAQQFYPGTLSSR